jgi:hypothetical protein
LQSQPVCEYLRISGGWSAEEGALPFLWSLASAEELEIARESLTRSLTSHFDTVANCATCISELFIHALGRHHFRKTLTRITGVSPQDVQRVAQQHLHPESMVVVAVGNTSKIEGDLSKLDLGPLHCVYTGTLPRRRSKWQIYKENGVICRRQALRATSCDGGDAILGCYPPLIPNSH